MPATSPAATSSSLIDDDQPCLAERRGPPRRRADSAARPRGSRAAARRRRRHRLPRAGRPSSTRRVRAVVFKTHRDRQGRRRRRVPPRRPDRRGRVPHRPPGAALHRAERHARRPRRRRRHGVRARCSARTTCTGRSRVLLGLPADKVRVVQAETGGGFGGKEEYPSIIAGHACAAGAEVGPAGEAGLRPRRGHARDDQAAPVDRPAPDRRDARRPADGDGHRRPDGRRRVLHAQPGRAVARRASTPPARTAATTCASAAAR